MSAAPVGDELSLKIQEPLRFQCSDPGTKQPPLLVRLYQLPELAR
jgi:hypothetical protein